MSAETARAFLDDLLPDGAFVTPPFDWSIGKGPAVDVSVGVSEVRLQELGITRRAFREGTDCWQVLTYGRAGSGNVKLASAMAPDEEAALIRLMGQLDVLRQLATGPWRAATEPPR